MRRPILYVAWFVLVVAWFVLVVAWLVLVFGVPARAHDWYDYECCSRDDCRPTTESITCVSGVCTVGGRRAERVKPSQDSRNHVCVRGGRILCVYLNSGT